jgi:hypothetical protein
MMLKLLWPEDGRKEISVAGKTPLKELFWMFFEEDGRKMAGRIQRGRKDASQRAILDVF